MCPERNCPNCPGEENRAESPSKRRLLNVLLGGSVLAWLGSVLYPMAAFLLPPPSPAMRERSVMVGTVNEFANNSGTLFRLGTRPGILVRTDRGEFRAFIAICTHLDCTVQFKEDESVIWCACHNGKFNLQGMNISGPPPRPLDPLEVSVRGDEVHVSLPA